MQIAIALLTKKIERKKLSGRSIPVVHLLWEQVDRVRFSAPRLNEMKEDREREAFARNGR